MIDRLIEYAKAKRDEAVTDGTINDCIFWNGYLAGLQAVKRGAEDGEINHSN